MKGLYVEGALLEKELSLVNGEDTCLLNLMHVCTVHPSFPHSLMHHLCCASHVLYCMCVYICYLMLIQWHMYVLTPLPYSLITLPILPVMLLVHPFLVTARVCKVY